MLFDTVSPLGSEKLRALRKTSAASKELLHERSDSWLGFGLSLANTRLAGKEGFAGISTPGPLVLVAVLPVEVMLLVAVLGDALVVKKRATEQQSV